MEKEWDTGVCVLFSHRRKRQNKFLQLCSRYKHQPHWLATTLPPVENVSTALSWHLISVVCVHWTVGAWKTANPSFTRPEIRLYSHSDSNLTIPISKSAFTNKQTNPKQTQNYWNLLQLSINFTALEKTVGVGYTISVTWLHLWKWWTSTALLHKQWSLKSVYFAYLESEIHPTI